MYTNLIVQFKTALYSTLVIGTPTLKLKHSVLLVMYSWINAIYHVMNGKYSIILLLFGSNS